MSPNTKDKAKRVQTFIHSFEDWMCNEQPKMRHRSLWFQVKGTSHSICKHCIPQCESAVLHWSRFWRRSRFRNRTWKWLVIHRGRRICVTNFNSSNLILQIMRAYTCVLRNYAYVPPPPLMIILGHCATNCRDHSQHDDDGEWVEQSVKRTAELQIP